MKFHYSNIPLFPMKEIIGETREMNRPKHMELHYQDSWFSEELPGTCLSKNTLHQILESIGGDRKTIVKFLLSLTIFDPIFLKLNEPIFDLNLKLLSLPNSLICGVILKN